MGWWLIITALTVMYASPAIGHIGWAMLISLAMLVVAYLASFVVARRLRGPNRGLCDGRRMVRRDCFSLGLPAGCQIYLLVLTELTSEDPIKKAPVRALVLFHVSPMTRLAGGSGRPESQADF